MTMPVVLPVAIAVISVVVGVAGEVAIERVGRADVPDGALLLAHATVAFAVAAGLALAAAVRSLLRGRGSAGEAPATHFGRVPPVPEAAELRGYGRRLEDHDGNRAGARVVHIAAHPARAAERDALLADLADAVERERLVLHYQPQVDLHSGRIVGVEALLRWQHPQRGLIGPGAFIEIAEDSGLILPIGEWVLARACSQARDWQGAGLPPVPVAVNLSARQCARSDVVEMVAGILRTTGLAPRYLELELTETVAMAEPERMVPLLRGLRDMGVALAIDDFGTGYSSMSYLQRFPVDKLKLDLSFVRGIVVEPESLVIAESIIALAHALRLRVVAEGVETQAQLALLAARGCDQMQGYFFSRPVPADEVARLLAEDRHIPRETMGRAGSRPAVLVLDDDPGVVELVRAASAGAEYVLHEATRVADAFEILARTEIAVVLCDERMPGMRGVEFLSRVRTMHPRTVRVLMSAYEDFDAARSAINRGAIYKFIGKPWSPEELRGVLDEALYRSRGRARG
ncbi:MAG: EAL domain-containing protein [Gammaproteobacteria bacterium]